MDNSFFGYIQQLELLAFFSGYPLLYALVNVLAGRSKFNKSIPVTSLLPLVYALAGTFYMGLQLRNLYPDYSWIHIQSSIQQPLWTIWAILSLLFWLPIFRNKPVLSLLHSLPFFFLLCRDLYFHSVDVQRDKNVVRNDMKIYTDSLLLLLGILAILSLIYFFRKRLKNRS
jgi:asparagine N-glycosylation enzyme membrane subunit Stt3